LVKIVKVGCCGFPQARSKYFSEYSVVELQNTFYNLPSPEWASKIRSEAPSNFEFTIKAWQVITHPSSSPTWRKMKKKPSGNLENYGFLKPTKENIEAFKKTIELANVLNAQIIVFQTPASMPYNEESIKWVEEFFEEIQGITNGKYIIGWEPRGEWSKHEDVLERILTRYNVLHIVDIFKKKPVNIVNNIFYTRLHGIGPGEVNYRYKYTDEDFEKLINYLEDLEFETGYIMFNNVFMAQDSKRFKEFLAEKTNYKAI